MRSFWLAVTLLWPAASAQAGNPYSYDSARLYSAKELFRVYPSLRGDPEYARLLAGAESPDPEVRRRSRGALVEAAYPIGLALGEIDSRGAAPAFFRAELAQIPPDFHGIVARFPDYQATVRAYRRWEGDADDEKTLGLVARSTAASAASNARATSMADAFWREALLDGAPPPAPAGSDGLHWDLEYAVDYMQTSYKPVDLQGDVSLAVMARRVPKVMLQVAAGQRPMPVDGTRHPHETINPIVNVDERLPTEQEILDRHLPSDETDRLLVDLRNRRLTIEGRRDPIRVDAMTKMFAQLFAEEAAQGVPPKFGTPLGWSPEFVAKYRGRMDLFPESRVSKLLVVLSCGLSSKYFATGLETQLIEYVLSRPDRSVTFHEMFRESYELNGGDVYLALMTCENILSEFWLTPQRENRAITRKLSPITNIYQDRGDIYGTWYHFFGMMLYSYTTSAKIAGSVARSESLGSDILYQGRVSPQKAWVNKEGAVMGERLKMVLRRHDYLDFDSGGVDYLDPKSYLDRNEDFRDRIFIAESRDFQAALAKGDVVIRDAGRDYKSCKVELMPDLGAGPDADQTVTIEGRDFAKGSESRFPGFSKRVRAVRVFLSCDGGLSAAMTAKAEGGDAR